MGLRPWRIQRRSWSFARRLRVRGWIPRTGPTGLQGDSEVMFGMLDDRAHKLFKLLMLPVWLLGRIMLIFAIGSGVVIAQWSGYRLLPKIVIAYVAFELVALLMGLFFWLITWIIRRMFFWVVD